MPRRRTCRKAKPNQTEDSRGNQGGHAITFAGKRRGWHRRRCRRVIFMWWSTSRSTTSFTAKPTICIATCQSRFPLRPWAARSMCRRLKAKRTVKIPAGTQSGQMFKLRGKGITNVNGRSHGDLFARLIVEVPSRLNPEQRQKLEEFAALCGDENTPMRKSFFDRAKEFFK